MVYGEDGEEGQKLVNFEGINFTISTSDGANNGTSKENGQFRVFLFTC